MPFGFLKNLDLFQITPQFYVGHEKSKTKARYYNRDFGTVTSFLTSLFIIFSSLGYFIFLLNQMMYGHLDKLNEQYIRNDFLEPIKLLDNNNNFVSTLMIRPFDQMFW